MSGAAPSSRARPALGRPAGYVLALSVVVVGAGVIWPQVAGVLLRGTLVALALALAVTLAVQALRPVAELRWSASSPFDRTGMGRVPPEEPAGLRRIRASLATTSSRRALGPPTIPHTIQGTIRAEATRRLARRHSLALGDPSQHDRIRSLVSPGLWAVIGPVPRPPGQRRPPVAREVPFDQLPRILDDLENL